MVKPTRIRVLVAVAATAGILGWAVARLADAVVGRYLPITWTAAVAVWLLAISLLMWTWFVRPKLLQRDGATPLSAHVAARTSALALASSRTGAAVSGFYTGVGVALLGEFIAPVARDSAIASVVASVGGLALVVVGMWLESMCRVDDSDEDLDSHGRAVRGATAQQE